MARTDRVLWNWERFSRVVRCDGNPRVWSRFPLELAPDLIVSPHLFDWPESAQTGSSAYTCAAVPDVVVFSVVSPMHRRFLEETVVPRVHDYVRVVVLVDFEANEMAVAHLGASPPIAVNHLATVLREAWGHNRIAEGRFAEICQTETPDEASFLYAPGDDHPDDPARCEATPVRLWEAFFWRGHTYRYEVIDGEVPLVADLRSPLAANRTLMQCVKDAEGLEGVRASEATGWIRCGRFRMRHEERWVEIRARLSPTDLRAAFMPQTRVHGDEALPSVVGALVAGGDNGKTEMMDGFTWSTIELASPAQCREAARSLAESIKRWTGSDVRLHAGYAWRHLKEHRDAWHIGRQSKWLSVYVPFWREVCLPWDVAVGDFSRRAPKTAAPSGDSDVHAG